MKNCVEFFTCITAFFSSGNMRKLSGTGSSLSKTYPGVGFADSLKFTVTSDKVFCLYIIP
jgi:hypothetical protein